MMPLARDAACTVAREAWADIGRHSRVDGIAERIRAAKVPAPMNEAKRQSERAAMQRRLKSVYDANRVSYRRAPDNSRYFPHQGPRECARRRRQIGAA